MRDPKINALLKEYCKQESALLQANLQSRRWNYAIYDENKRIEMAQHRTVSLAMSCPRMTYLSLRQRQIQSVRSRIIKKSNNIAKDLQRREELADRDAFWTAVIVYRRTNCQKS